MADQESPATGPTSEPQSLTASPSASPGYYDSSSPAQNPEPPPELLNRQDLISADKVGDTVFSKHWLFTTLMKLIQAVDAQHEGKEGPEKEATETGLDLDENLQDELCELWDMSMNGEVVKFLQEFKAVDILTGVIAKSRAPRATEICIGILGNMGCNDDACREMAANTKLLELVVLLLSEPDAPTLVEIMRFLLTVISNTSHNGVWIDKIKSKEGFLSSITFILTSSTNLDLLRNAAMFLDKLLYVEEELCARWATSDLVVAVLEAAKQIGCRPGETLDALLHILQLLSTAEQGVSVLVDRGDDLSHLLLQYLLHMCSEEILGIEGHENSLSSAFSTLNVIIVSSPDANTLLFQDYDLVRCLLKVLDVVYAKLHPESSHQRQCTGRRRSRTRSRYVSESRVSPEKGLQTADNPAKTSDAPEDVTSSSDKPHEGDVFKKDLSSEADMKDDERQEDSGAGDGLRETTNNVSSTSQNVPGDASQEAAEDYDITRLRVLYDVLQMFLHDLTAMLASDQKEEVARSMLYFETGCSRDRLYAMVWTLMGDIQNTDNSSSAQVGEAPASKGLQQVSALKDLAEKYELRRFQGILDDALELYSDSRRL